MYDSIVYDTIIETAEDNHAFEFAYGRIQLADGTGLVIGSILGALIANQFGLRSAYFLSIPLILCSVIALWQFQEPQLHKMKATIPLPDQLRATVKAVLRNRSLLPIVLVLILRAMLSFILFEFSQVWLLAIHLPTAYYGVANASLLASIGVGGILAGRLRLSRYFMMLMTILFVLAGFIGLITFRSAVTIVVAQFIVQTGLIVINVIFQRILHDNVSSSIRAGAASASSTLGRSMIIPLALLFGYISKICAVFQAAYLLFGLGLIMALLIMSVANRNNRKGLQLSDSASQI